MLHGEDQLLLGMPQIQVGVAKGPEIPTSAQALQDGKDADLLLVDGELFDPGAHIVHVFIAGEKVYSQEASS